MDIALHNYEYSELCNRLPKTGSQDSILCAWSLNSSFQAYHLTVSLLTQCLLTVLVIFGADSFQSRVIRLQFLEHA